MIIEQIYTENSLRNFNYIIACPNTKEAVVVDPLRVDLIEGIINAKGYKVTKIINTHEHADHTDGNIDLINKTGAEVFCHHNAIDKIPGASAEKSALYKDDVITIGDCTQLKVLDTPGHTMAHVCLLAIDKNSNLAIFSGDTLFNAGAGNVMSGNVDDLYNTFVDILFKLPDDTKVYPGHDYIENNLNFTLSREPNNARAKELLQQVSKQDAHKPLVTTLGLEKEFNTFFRLSNLEIISKLSSEIDGFSDSPTEKQVFVALRELRNNW